MDGFSNGEDGKRIGRYGIDILIYCQWNWNKWLMATLLRSEIVAVIGSIRNRCCTRILKDERCVWKWKSSSSVVVVFHVMCDNITYNWLNAFG